MVIHSDALDSVVTNDANYTVVAFTALTCTHVHVVLEILEALETFSALHQWALAIFLLEIQIIGRSDYWRAPRHSLEILLLVGLNMQKL